MTWSAVTWAYKDVITSAKLAQMVENDRTHDHFTTDQGQRLGILGSGTPNGTTTTAATALGTYFAISATVTIPSGLTAGRRVLVLASGDFASSSGTQEPAIQLYRDTTALGSYGVVAGATAGRPNMGVKTFSEPAPAAGTYTYRLTVMSANAAVTITSTGLTLDVLLL